MDISRLNQRLICKIIIEMKPVPWALPHVLGGGGGVHKAQSTAPRVKSSVKHESHLQI